MVDFSEYKNLSKFEKTFLDEFLNDIEKREKSNWNKPWNFANYQNAFSEYEYSGLNQVMLELVSRSRELSDPRFATFNQAKKNEYHIQKGSKGIPLQFFSFIDKRTKKPWDEQEFRENSKEMTKDEIEKELQNKVPLAKTFHVFNAKNLISNKNGLSLSENVPFEQFTKKINTNKLIDSFENNLISNMEVNFVERHSEGAYYTPERDQVTMPLKEQFNSYEERMAVLLHELGHATGHEKRLNRDLTGTFGSSNYSKEEMKVEMNSVFMTNLLGLELSDEQKQNHLLYLDSWGKTIKDNPKEFISAVRDSLKIKDYMIEKGKFNDIFLEKVETLEHGIEPNEFEKLITAYNDFTSREYNNDFSIEEAKKIIIEEEDYKMPIAYTEEDDNLSIISCDKQSTYDLKDKVLVNTLTTEYANVLSKENLSINEMAETLNETDFNYLVSSDNFGIDLEDLSNTIKISAYTNDDTFLKNFAKENNIEIDYDMEAISIDKNYLLSELDDNTISFFEEKGVALSNDFIHDYEYKHLTEFQLSHYEKVTEQSFPPFEKVVYSPDIENEENTKTFSNYKDLWETEFKNSFKDDFNNFTIEELENNEILTRANPNLINRLAKNYDDIGRELRNVRTAMESRSKEGERDLDNDGIPERLDVDDNRIVAETVGDLHKIGTGIDKSHEKETKKVEDSKKKQRTR